MSEAGQLPLKTTLWMYCLVRFEEYSVPEICLCSPRSLVKPTVARRLPVADNG